MKIQNRATRHVANANYKRPFPENIKNFLKYEAFLINPMKKLIPQNQLKFLTQFDNFFSISVFFHEHSRITGHKEKG